MDEKDYGDLIDKTCKKFKKISPEKIKGIGRKMFAREYANRTDNNLLIVHTRGSAFCHILPVPYSTITNNIYIFLDIVYKFIKKSRI
ncbi:hypothetical protein D4R87_02510 [bacterium]|nr:MAG: hypothetical protein D4R87_02510 [bacterium]